MADINDINRINQARLVAENSLEQKNIERIQNTQNYKAMNLYEHWDECKELIFKLRTELIQYITEHGLVHGFLWQGHDHPIRNGKISITKKMIKDVTDTFGYLTDETGTTLIMQILTNGHYVSDEHYVHTDNNFTNDLKEKLDGIEPGAEVNKVVDVQFNGTSVVNDERVAVINLTNEDIKRMYEENPDTNCLTDALLSVLESVEPFKEKTARNFEVVHNTISEKEQALLKKINNNKAEIERVESESRQRDTDNLNSLTEKIREVDENAKSRDNAIENSIVEARAEATANYNVNKTRIDEANQKIEQQNIKLQELDLLQIKEVTKEELDDRVIYKLKSKANQFIDTFIEIKKLPDDFNPVMNITIEKTGEKYKFKSVKRNGDEYAFETSDFNALIEQATSTINTEIEGIKALLGTLKTKTESIDTRLNEIQANLQPIVDGWQEIRNIESKVLSNENKIGTFQTKLAEYHGWLAPIRSEWGVVKQRGVSNETSINNIITQQLPNLQNEITETKKYAFKPRGELISRDTDVFSIRGGRGVIKFKDLSMRIISGDGRTGMNGFSLLAHNDFKEVTIEMLGYLSDNDIPKKGAWYKLGIWGEDYRIDPTMTLRSSYDVNPRMRYRVLKGVLTHEGSFRNFGYSNGGIINIAIQDSVVLQGETPTVDLLEEIYTGEVFVRLNANGNIPKGYYLLVFTDIRLMMKGNQ